MNASPTINPFTVQRAGPRCEQPAALNPGDRFSRSWISWVLWARRGERGEEEVFPLDDADFRRVEDVEKEVGIARRKEILLISKKKKKTKGCFYK